MTKCFVNFAINRGVQGRQSPLIMNYSLILEKVHQHVHTFFESHQHPLLVFHNEKHTQGVVAAATQIVNHYQLDEKDAFTVITAAWFHDLGYHQQADQHEKIGAGLAESFLKEEEVAPEVVKVVKQCILATKMPQNPANLLEQIVCDADLFHLGSDDFPERNKLMRKEYEAVQGVAVSKDEWRLKTIDLLQGHQYKTDYCRNLLTEKKNQNLKKLMDRLTEDALAVVEQKKKRKSEEKEERPDRSIETMFRITSANSQRLSDQADTKSHIMISVNSIIISVLLSVVVKSIDDHTNLTIPVTLLLTVNLITIIFSILATRPNIPSGTFRPEDIEEKKINLLFFGNFYRMNFDDYSSGMFTIMNDKYYLHLTLLRDVYNQGVVLGRKYRMLKMAYNVFMYGLIVSVIAFFIASKFYSN